MFDAQLLIRGSANSSVYSPWFPRGGDYLRATAELVTDGGAELDISVYTKNRDNTSDYNGLDVDTAKLIELISSSTRVDEEWGPNASGSSAGGLQELVRYKYTVKGTSGEWILFRMLSPVWFDAVDA